jgi:hypothetical protein
MSLLDKLTGWWRKDERERIDEEGTMTDAERAAAEEEYSGHRADVRMESGYYEPAGQADYERDSERPGR